VNRADPLQQRGLLGAADDVDQADAILEADLVEHLAQVRGRGGVDQGGVTLQAHGPDHAERRQRIDEAGRAVRRGRARWQHQAILRLHRPVLGVHGAAEDGDLLAHQRLGRGRGSGGDHGAGSFVAGRHRLVQPGRHGPHAGFGDLGDDGVALALGGAHIGRAE